MQGSEQLQKSAGRGRGINKPMTTDSTSGAKHHKGTRYVKDVKSTGAAGTSKQQASSPKHVQTERHKLFHPQAQSQQGPAA